MQKELKTLVRKTIMNFNEDEFWEGIFTMEPAKAVEYLEARGYKVSKSWKDMTKDEFKRAFTVAGVMKIDILKKFRESLEEALREGVPFEEWKKRITKEFADAGWIDDPEVQKVTTKSRLDNIYRTNLQSAYMRGRFEQMDEVADLRPYYRVIAIRDKSTSRTCKDLDGKIFLIKDNPRLPPYHYRCRSEVETLSERQVKGEKITSSKVQQKSIAEGFDSHPRSYLTIDESKYNSNDIKALRKRQPR